MPPVYFTLGELLQTQPEPTRLVIERLLQEHRERFRVTLGSAHNHQAWFGGYLDHVIEAMNIAVALYDTLDARRPLPFTCADALLVLFLHDLEKPWRDQWEHLTVEGLLDELKRSLQDDRISNADRAELIQLAYDRQTAASPKDFRRLWREKFIAKLGVLLTADQLNALRYVEGEGVDYSSAQRRMRPLAAFCHMCDIASARIWFDHPLPAGETWGARGFAPARLNLLEYPTLDGVTAK